MAKHVEFKAGDVIKMKKQHPCGSDLWEVIFAGSDVKMKCKGCGRMVIVARSKIVSGIKEVLPGPVDN